jgi:hypothetical protein
LKWYRAEVNQFRDEHPQLDFSGVAVRGRYSAPFGWTPFPSRAGWTWEGFPRELDVVIGRTVDVEGEKSFALMLAVELKVDAVSLNTVELDKKSATYGALREVYRWVHTVLLFRGNTHRHMTSRSLLRNARGFDTLFREWSAQTEALFRNLPRHRLD